MSKSLTIILACALMALAETGVVLGQQYPSKPILGQQYPSKPIRLIVPFSPGGGTDMLARTIAQKLNESWAQPVVVDNRAGGSGNIGTDMVAKALPDGYTILMGYVGNLAINPSLYRSLPYDAVKDFVPVTLAATAPNVLVAHPSVTANSVRDLIALAKAKPGTLNYSTGSTGGSGNGHGHEHCACAVQGERRRHRRHPWRQCSADVQCPGFRHPSR
jgi:tripartite-type tricarboxylate transporter receptor subunit TctC